MYVIEATYNKRKIVRNPSEKQQFFDVFFQKRECLYLLSTSCDKDNCIYFFCFTFTGNGTSSSGARRADEVRGLSETGYSYFGARYYDSDLSGLFLSIDPMADKYPSISPYAYCAWNPIKLVDPNGMDTIVSIGLSKGNVDYWYDDESYNGTFVDLIDDNNQISRYKCTGSVSFSEESNIDRTTVSFSKDMDANDVFDKLTGINELNVGSEVEWNYYQQKNGTGNLVTSHKKDEVNVTDLESKYNTQKTQSFHHFHPNTPGSACWTPSPEDQAYSMSLGVPSFLHFKKQNYQYDNIVRTYGVMDYYQFQGHVPNTIIK